MLGLCVFSRVWQRWLSSWPGLPEVLCGRTWWMDTERRRFYGFWGPRELNMLPGANSIISRRRTISVWGYPCQLEFRSRCGARVLIRMSNSCQALIACLDAVDICFPWNLEYFIIVMKNLGWRHHGSVIPLLIFFAASSTGHFKQGIRNHNILGWGMIILPTLSAYFLPSIHPHPR